MERESLDALLPRGVKYTCVDAQSGRLALGTATGSLHFFDAAQQLQLRLLEMAAPSELRGVAVARVRLSPPPAALCAAATADGFLYVLSAAFATARDRAKVLLRSAAHRDASTVAATSAAQSPSPEITALEWDAASERLYSGDDAGNVFVTTVHGLASALFGSQLLVRLGAAVVQLSASPQAQQQLLASDTAKSVLIDAAAGKSAQVGRQLRSGAYGGCFHPTLPASLLLARPNMRVWLASLPAEQQPLPKVEKTLRFEATADGAKSLGRLLPLCGDRAPLVLSCSADGHIALLDAEKPALLDSVVDIAAVDDAAVDSAFGHVFVLAAAGASLARLTMQGVSLPLLAPARSPSIPIPPPPSSSSSSPPAQVTGTPASPPPVPLPSPKQSPPQKQQQEEPAPTVVASSLPAVPQSDAQQRASPSAVVGTPIDDIVPVKRKKASGKRRVVAVVSPDHGISMSPRDSSSPSVATSVPLQAHTTPRSISSVLSAAPPSDLAGSLPLEAAAKPVVAASKTTTEAATTSPSPQPASQQSSTPSPPHRSFSSLANKMMKGLLSGDLRNLIDKRTQQHHSRAPSASSSSSSSSSSPTPASVPVMPLQQQVSLPTDQDSGLEFPLLTDRAYAVLCACVEGRAGANASQVLRAWLEIWLRAAIAVVPSDPSMQSPETSQQQEAVQQLATACFELQVGAPAGPEQEKLSISFVQELWPVLLPRRCSIACSEWRWVACLRELLPLYRIGVSAADQHVQQVFDLLEAGDAAGAITALRSSNFEDVGLLLLVLPELAFLNHKLAVALCVELYPGTLLPWHIREFAHSQAFFLKYLSKLFAAHASLLHEDLKLAEEWFGLLLGDKAPEKSLLFIDGADAPLPGSHAQLWSHHAQLMSVIDVCVASGIDSERAETLSGACASAGFWAGLLRLLPARGKLADAIELAVAVDDWTALEKLFSRERSLPQQLWQRALAKTLACALPKDQHREEMLQQPRAVTTERLIDLMLARCGPILTADVISTVPGGAEALSPAAMRSILRVGRVSLVDQPAVVRSLLSTVDSYLWSKRPWVSSPQLRAVAELEATGSEGAARLATLPFAENTTGSGAAAPKLVPAFAFSPLQASFEEASNSHWGVACSAAAAAPGSTPQLCAFCGLPLVMPDESAALLLRPGLSVSSKSLVSSNLVVFPRCGHAYHQSCLGSDACVLCLHANLTSISKVRFVV